VGDVNQTQSRRTLDREKVLQLFRDFFFFTGEMGPTEFANRVKYLALAALFSAFWFALPPVHSVLLLGTVSSFASLIVRRLRNLSYHWAIAFLGLFPVLGWIALALIVTSRAKASNNDTLSIGKRLFSGAATFFALALLLISGSMNAAANSSTTSESSQSVNAEDEANQEQLVAEQAAQAEEQAALEEGEEVRLSEEKKEDAEAEQLAQEDALQAGNQTFDQLIAGLTVEPEVSSGYDRDLFKHWIDVDRDGCDTREEVLITESTTPVSIGGSCSLSGGTWVSAFDGVSTTNSSSFDVDHFVPLKEAWDSGANGWDSTTRQNFANDLGYEMSLIAVSASSNRSKSDRDPSDWMPSEAEFKCDYVYAWIQVKLRWKLSVDAAEVTALRNNWSGCTLEALNFKAKASGATIVTGPTPAPAPKTNNQESAEPAPSVTQPEVSGCVNINTASFEALQQIQHIGPDRAQQILSLRPFSSLNDMGRINGIAVGGDRLNEIKAQGLACVG
jgi:DNA uptake protein ComE-like DNA-binding protein/uncharacterized membrane protein YhaH (DUF805 family)